MKYLLILISIVSVSCNNCEYIPMLDLSGQPLLHPDGTIACSCECTFNDWSPCNSESIRWHVDCIKD